MGWHPSWYVCQDCGLVYLEQHPSTCYCGEIAWMSIDTEHMFSIIARDRTHSKNCDCFEPREVEPRKPADKGSNT